MLSQLAFQIQYLHSGIFPINFLLVLWHNMCSVTHSFGPIYHNQLISNCNLFLIINNLYNIHVCLFPYIMTMHAYFLIFLLFLSNVTSTSEATFHEWFKKSCSTNACP